MTGWWAATRYEWTMQVRRPALWVTSALLLGLTLIISGFIDAFHDPDPKVAMVRAAVAASVPLPIGYAFVLADRLVRDRELHLTDLLDATPAGGLGRLLGKYCGGGAAAAVPIVAVYLGDAVGYAAVHRAPVAVVWGLAIFATVLLPALVLAGALAMCLPLVMPPAVFRTLFVGFWIWASWLIPPSNAPVLGETVLSPTGGYAVQVLFGYHGRHADIDLWAGPVPGATLNVLRPGADLATVGLSLLVTLGVAATALTLTHRFGRRDAR